MSSDGDSFFDNLGKGLAAIAALGAVGLGRALTQSGDDIARMFGRHADDVTHIAPRVADDVTPNHRTIDEQLPPPVEPHPLGTKTVAGDHQTREPIITYPQFQQLMADLGQDLGEDLVTEFIQMCLNEEPDILCWQSAQPNRDESGKLEFQIISFEEFEEFAQYVGVEAVETARADYDAWCLADPPDPVCWKLH